MAWFPLRLVPEKTKIDFLSRRYLAFALSVAVTLGSFALLGTRGLNFGIDFTGGILMEVRFETAPDMSALRQDVSTKELGDISLQHFGDDETVLIRIGQQEGSEESRIAAVHAVKEVLSARYGESVTYRKVDYVGPKVGSELIQDGVLALVLAVLSIVVYVWFRFEWQFGVGAVLALAHDAIATFGFYSLTGIEFNLSSVAAVLTIIGYSINDSVVIFDRIRENMRKYQKMGMAELLNLSINETLSRTLMTVITTLLALVALIWLGGPVVQSFSLAAFFGIVIGTYSSIYVSAPVLIHTGLERITTTKKSS